MKIVVLTTDNREQQNDYGNPTPHFGPAPTALLEGFSNLDGVEVHVISCIRRRIHSPDMVMGNIHYHPVYVPKAGWMTTLYYGCIQAVKRKIRDINPDIVHGQGTERDCAMTAVYSGYPNVLTIHGNMSKLHELGHTFQSARLYGYLASKLENHALRKTSGVFCNSLHTQKLVTPRTRETWLMPNPIRREFLSTSQESYCSQQKPLILNVGSVCQLKRQLEVLRMAKHMHQSGHSFHLKFAGNLSLDSDYASQFHHEIKEAEKDGYASYAGFLNASELAKLMDCANGFIHFPIEEAFGLVVAEALSRGLKLFGANTGGVKDIVSGMSRAELHDDMESLQNGVMQWLDEGAKRAPEDAKLAQERYSPESIARQHLEIYSRVISMRET